MEEKRSTKTWALVMGLFIIGAGVFSMPYVLKTKYDLVSNSDISVGATTSSEVREVVRHVATPESVRAIYMTACVAGTPSWREKLKKLVENTELNSILIDIKDYTGVVSFPNNYPKTGEGKGCVVRDMKEFIASLHDSNIYVIGRVSVFQDPSYTKLFPELAVKSKSTGGVWKDRKGLSFVDVGAKEYWKYIVEIAKDSYTLGFDEVNFDYIRYPSDGNMKDADYTYMNASSTGSTGSPLSKPIMLEGFFSYLKKELGNTGVVTSADLFGLTTVAFDDLGIGQELLRALSYFDYVAPMVYPSHFAAGTAGFKNPAEYPYEIIKYSMGKGHEREVAMNIANGLATSTPSKLRPWLQDFDLGAQYGEVEVKAQIQATYDVGLIGWMIWDPTNKYSVSAFAPE